MSLRSLVSRRRPIRTPALNAPRPGPAAAAARAGMEPLETRVLFDADVLTPVADTFVRDPSFDTTNFGDSPFLYVKTAGSGDNRRAFMRFDVSDWGAGEIGSAVLYLAGALQTPTTPPITAGIFAVADADWVEGDGNLAIRSRSGGIPGSQLGGTSPGDGYDRDNSPTGEMTWNTQLGMGASPVAAADITDETFRTYAFDLTAHIQQARAAGQGFVTLGIMNIQATAHMTRFLSREFDGPGRPQLVITDAGDADGSVVRTHVNAPDVTVGGSPSHAITVTYAGTAPVDTSTIDVSDLVVTRDGGSPITVESVSFDPPFNSSTVTATYVVRRGAAWEVTDNDLYTVHLRAGEVRDVEGNDSLSNFSTFRSRVFDTTAPTAAVNASNVTSGGAGTYSFTVNYSDNIAIDAQTLNINNTSITDPNGGRIHPIGVTISPDDDASQILATYTVEAPGGAWDVNDNGTYNITLHTQTVRDTAANEVAEFVTPFTVNVQGPDTGKPTASISASNITAAGNGNHTVTVLYGDDRGINSGSIDIGDITVIGPQSQQLQVLDVDVSPGGSGQPQTATYVIAPPAGGWNSTTAGTYTITLKPNEVADTSGNFNDAAAGTFSVDITPPPPADTEAPTASIAANNVTSGGGVVHAITVTYRDNNAVIGSSIDREDVTVTGPGGIVLNVSGVQVSPPGDAARIDVTYQIDAPGGGQWDDEDDGGYTIRVNPGTVRDAAGNVNSEISANFTVDIGGPDTAGPTATFSLQDVTVPGGATHQITIIFDDDGKVQANSIDPTDISVVRIRDNAVMTVTGGAPTLPGDAQSKTAVYTIAAPGGSWDPSDDGTYRVTLLPDAVRDRRGNFAASNTATFSVSTTIVDTTPPTASIAPVPNVTTAGDTPISVVVTYSDNQPIPLSVLNNEDVVITTPTNETLVASAAQVLPGGTDPNVVTVRYDFAPPGGAWDVSDTGTYTVSLAPGQVVDAANNPAVLSGTVQFVVDVPAPPPIDPNFGAGNPIATNFVVEAITAQPDGKLVLVGRRGVAGTPESVGVIQRRNADGSLDNTFGGGDGEVVTDAGQGTTYYAVGIQAFENGRFMIVVGGTAFGALDADFVAARYDAAGNLDAAFGAGGRALADFGQAGEAAYGLAVGPDNKIVLGGGSADHFAFARLGPDGMLDPTFGQGGKNLFDADGVDVVAAVAIQRDGKILAAGSSGPNVVVIRLNANGEQDLGFANQSVLIVPGLRSRLEAQSDVDRSQAIAIQRDDMILVGNFTAEGNDFGVARIDLAGRLDPTFGTNGIASVDLGGNDDVDAVVLQETGEILAVGTTDAGGTPVTAVAAFDTTGRLIGGFGENGVLRFDPAVSTPGREVHIGDLVLRAFGTRQADGRLVVTSTDRSPAQTSSSLRRLNVPGTRATRGTLIGEFGNTGGRRAARLVDPVTGAIFIMRGGTGQAFRTDDGRIDLILTDGGAGVTVNVRARNRVPLGDIICRGTIRSLNIRTGDLAGTMFVGGMLFRARLGNISGGTVAVNGAITSLLVDNLDQAKILSGANLGEDARLGGTDSNADTFGQGIIGAVKVRGQIVNSIVAAGLNPVDGVIGNDDDTVAGGSVLRTLSARNADENSRFYGSTFRSVRLPKKVDPATDPRFKTV